MAEKISQPQSNHCILEATEKKLQVGRGSVGGAYKPVEETRPMEKYPRTQKLKKHTQKPLKTLFNPCFHPAFSSVLFPIA